jgi:hypothetical protein
MSDIDDLDTIDARTHAEGDVTLVMNVMQARALRDYIDTIDIPDLTQNPDTHGFSADDARDFSDVLGRLAHALGTVYPY